MCGIIGATGGDQVLPLLLDGLARLEYRGYDSAGVALCTDEGLWRARAAEGTRSLQHLRKQAEAAPEPGWTAASAIPGGRPTAIPPRSTPTP